MRIIRDFDRCPDAYKGAVVALGNFDGVHLGHQAILKACVEQAQKNGGKTAVMTFEPHPREFFARDHAPLRIYPLRRKLQLLQAMGTVDAVFLSRFNRRLASTSAHDFVESILHKQLKVTHVVTGYNFAFGKNRQGDTTFLENMVAELGFGFTRVPPINDENCRAISSSEIRELLAEGHVEDASRLLGRPYSIGGRVIKGDRRGRSLGYPTANLRLDKLFKPKFGIYAARVTFKDGGICDAVANVGIRPMFVSEHPLLEVHCFGVDRAFYGERIDVALVKFLREERMFDSEDALRAQMETDGKDALSILKRGAHGG